MTDVDYYRAENNEDAYTLYADTGDSLFFEIHYPSDDVGDVHKLGASWSVNRIIRQFDADHISPREIDGLFRIKGEILAVLESTDEQLTTDEIHEEISEDSVNNTYGSLKHLTWDSVIERHGSSTWSH
jgi:hypothetical protein